ncbi:spexin prohormone 1 isoform X2 [Astyanax mexicanus]|uniref:spexin prohormone 1 isoform X2 n=1 Tax=Astyanax mexicanus TaxID=7994 RepID=UPI0020CB4DE7|nr:spexin prohormone 1 isoform X2 [Astyanax mexicanus]
MKGLKALTAYALALLLLATFVSYACSAPKAAFQRRNWTPQAMLYLKGTQTRSQNTENLSVSKAATVLLNFLQQVKEEGDDNGLFFQDIPAWKRDYF